MSANPTHLTRVSAVVLRWIAKDIDRLRYPLLRLGRVVDALDRQVGNASWACRHKASRIERGEVDDGIPF